MIEGLPYMIVGAVMLLIFLFNLKKIVKKPDTPKKIHEEVLEEPVEAKIEDDVKYEKLP